LCICALGCTAGAPVKLPTPLRSPGLDVGQYATIAEAKAACASDRVVWENPNTGVLYPLTDRDYLSKNRPAGDYMCQSFAIKNGMVMVR
jgi:hypothetical protein